MKEYSGRGIGGGLGLLFAVLLGIVNIFLMPAEVGDLYSNECGQPPVTWLPAFWVLIPLIGGIIWVIPTQGRLNDYRLAHGVTA
jgi:hypothetical protein